MRLSIKIGLSAVAMCVMLAGCTSSSKPPAQIGSPSGGQLQSNSDEQTWRGYYEPDVFTTDTTQTPFQIMLPEGFDPSKQYPVVLFLHGAGERGDDNNVQLNNGGKLFVEHRADFPAIVIFPQAPKDDYWAVVEADRSHLPFTFDYPFTGENEVPPTKALEGVMALSDWVTDQPFVDTSRLYLVGLSMGGMGSYELLARKPDVFAAAVVICGGANAELVDNIRADLPLWAFHGGADDIVVPEYNLRMVNGLKQQGNPVKFTVFEGVNHNSWDSAFAEPQLFSWLFSHVK